VTTDACLAVDWALTSTQRQNFLSRWYAFNPGQRGALVADVLTQLVDADEHLDITEPILEAWPNSSAEGRALIRPAILALYYIEGIHPWTERVMELVARAGGYFDKPEAKPERPFDGVPTLGLDRIANARREQIQVHGHTPEHDRAEHPDGSIAKAAAAYAMAVNGSWQGVELYPWSVDPDRAHPIQPVLRGQEGDDRRIEYLAAAGALCAAEIDRLVAEKERQ
jgi:hypothetical protein